MIFNDLIETENGKIVRDTIPTKKTKLVHQEVVLQNNLYRKIIFCIYGAM